MIKLTLTNINREQKYSQVKNKPYESVSIQATEYGTKWLKGFGNDDNKNWAVGDVVEVLKVEEVHVGQNVYLNFEMPKVDKAKVSDETKKELLNMSFKLGAMSLKIDAIIEHLAGRKGLDETSDGSQMPKF